MFEGISTGMEDGMREKINRLAEGNYEYEQSRVIVTPEVLDWNHVTKQVYQTSLVISNEKRHLMKGIVTTHAPEITIDPVNFRGVDSTIVVSVDMERVKPGENFESVLQIISDCGNEKVSLCIPKESVKAKASGHQIEDLSQFVSLVQKDIEAGVKLFDTPAFRDGLLAKDAQKQAIYDGLRAPAGRKNALDNFLVSIGKKKPVTIAVEQVYRQYDACREAFQDEISITKNTWGYEEFQICSDASFLRIENEHITTEEFVGDRFVCKYEIDPEQMVMGKNYARIEIKNTRQTIKISVVAVKPGVQHEKAQKNRREQRTLCQMLKRHLAFCMNRLPLQDYLQEMDQLLQGSGLEKNSTRLQLYRIHLAIMEHQAEVVTKGLNSLEEQAEELRKEHPERYAGFCYLKGIWTDDESVKEECIRQIRDCYEETGQDAQVLWCLLYLDPELQSEKKKFTTILEQLTDGCYSPIFYLEICQILNDTPKYLTELSEVIVQALHWGCKNHFIEKETALRYVYLAGRLRQYSAGVLEDMTLLYDRYPEDEILTVICKMLMRGQITTKDAFVWYERGVNHNLKITELYEYYMYSIDEKETMAFTHSVLLYFLYDNHLTVDKKAMLYAYVVRQKDKDPETYESYRTLMQNFTWKQLREGRISTNLGVLYNEFVTEEVLDKEMAVQLAGFLLQYEITCDNPNMVGVYVSHPELSEEHFAPFVKGKAVITCATSRAKLFLIDREYHRYADDSWYRLKPLLEMDGMKEVCYRFDKQNRALLLALGEQASKQAVDTAEMVELRAQLLACEGLRENYRHALELKQMQYFYQRGERGRLEEALEQLDWTTVEAGERGRMIEYCAWCECFAKAMEGILQFGFEGIPIKRLQTISEQAFQDASAVPDERMLCLAWKLFTENAYSEPVLKYLMRFFSGTVAELVCLWQAAGDLLRESLEERLLAQSIFSGEVVPEVFTVFAQYKEHAGNKQIIRAFKKWMAYEYLLRGRQLPEELFADYFVDVQKKEDMPCLLAVLKHMSGKAELSEEEAKFADYHVGKLYDQKMIFAFYRNFYGKISLPEHVLDQVYVEYIANPDHDVALHYRIYVGADKGKYAEVKMRNVFAGIHVREFVLFEDERLEYYITEHYNGKDHRSEVQEITTGKDDIHPDTGSRYAKLNEMMAAKNSGEDEKLIDLMESFTMEREIAASIFEPL